MATASLIGLFFLTALLYAMVGFGGGSTYNALLLLDNTPYEAIPFIALLCNLLVVGGGVWHFSNQGHLSLSRGLPWIIFSVPSAFVGGLIPLSEDVFIGFLGLALLLSGLKMLLPELKASHQSERPYRLYIPLFTGSGLGLVAGITGIGGGIFLAPILYFLRWGSPKQIAGLCSLFILVNSLSGLVGQGLKLQAYENLLPLIETYWLLFPTVVIGGQIGSRLTLYKIKASFLQKMTALLILYVALRLLWRFTH
ncbi:sulfite exporter TauE/SafE family protein [Temperatibacter marinus]|uniref:Probable membrane transporter protein n=1 Tax=Temperatibacter marinus TaxID=1456591 RepID=A0AA52HA35_9PROT|nr:sulfite exporter TauE/SafE family protein [Temperatibacter marinus]WND03564.1 sulfite exporter TauE/SafE family protein [Temperatibacter marinus]